MEAVLRTEDQYHVGIVVDDFEAMRAFFAETAGVVWGPVIRVPYEMQVPSGSVRFENCLCFSVNEPRLELVQSVAGTPMQPSSSGLHHFGYWCEDVAVASAGLAAKGWAWECGGNLPDGSPAWAYHFNPAGVRIEVVSTAMKEAIESMWSAPG